MPVCAELPFSLSFHLSAGLYTGIFTGGPIGLTDRAVNADNLFLAFRISVNFYACTVCLKSEQKP